MTAAANVYMERFSSFSESLTYASITELQAKLKSYQDLEKNPATPDFLKDDLTNRILMLKQALEDSGVSSDVSENAPAPNQSNTLELYSEFCSRLKCSDKADLIRELRMYTKMQDENNVAPGVSQDIARRIEALNSVLNQMDVSTQICVLPNAAEI